MVREVQLPLKDPIAEFIEMEMKKVLTEYNILDIGFIEFCRLIIKWRICNINVDEKVLSYFHTYFNTFNTDKLLIADNFIY